MSKSKLRLLILNNLSHLDDERNRPETTPAAKKRLTKIIDRGFKKLG